MLTHELISTIDLFKQAKVLVIGDIMLDQYIFGDTSRISPEAPVPIVKKREFEDKPGGAGNVALNIRKLGAKVSLLGMCGNDPEGDSLDQSLTNNGINISLIRTPLPTIKKTRILSKHQQLLRIDTESSYNELDHSELLDKASKLIDEHDTVVLSDYAKGTLTPVLQDLIKIARFKHKKVIVDPKEADLSRYKNANWITPNLNEFLTSADSNADDGSLQTRADRLIKDNNFDGILLTRSEKGMSLFSNNKPPLHLPAKVREVFDVTGAGDTVIALMATGLSVTENLNHIIELANTAAGIVVGKMGAAYVTPEEIKLEISKSEFNDKTRTFGIIEPEQLEKELQIARLGGEKIVFTNGCFDILHAGHVKYLEEAKALGDRLIVAVNSDDSVKTLKGEMRPIIPLAQRMRLLSSLKFVDWVVPFNEETPEKLICKLLPDILTKGGDYKAENIAGYDCIKKNNGETIILSFTDNISTSNIIKTIKLLGDNQ
ncbi:MAG: bifunctional D-glycero-beta-D-manno-heptose-7-phosphate kinase/D-glycero-beta-D-manno-heptose 1-phosphate adenylyltransferase HldE [Gammaproteobacteria bacterium]